jgi:hypothetical protein
MKAVAERRSGDLKVRVAALGATLRARTAEVLERLEEIVDQRNLKHVGERRGLLRQGEEVPAVAESTLELVSASGGEGPAVLAVAAVDGGDVKFVGFGKPSQIGEQLLVSRQGLDLEALGLTREDLQRRFAAARERQSPEPERLIVQPQERRKALRTRLQEQTQSAANRILEALGERPSGRRIALLGGTGAANNLGAVIALMHRAVNDHLVIESNARRDQSIEALEQGITALDDVADGVEADLRERLNGAGA